MYNNDFLNSNDANISGNNNYINNETDVNVNVNEGQKMNYNVGGGCQGRVKERIINRTFVHEVPHTCPIHTRIINHHVYKHTYRPVYTCSEENVCSNVQCGSCSQFM